MPINMSNCSAREKVCLNQWRFVHWRTYASLGINALKWLYCSRIVHEHWCRLAVVFVSCRHEYLLFEMKSLQILFGVFSCQMPYYKVWDFGYIYRIFNLPNCKNIRILNISYELISRDGTKYESPVYLILVIIKPILKVDIVTFYISSPVFYSNLHKQLSS